MNNISNLLAIIFILLLIVNCKKKEEYNEIEKFYYKDFQPNIEVLCCDSIFIDFNNDNINDIGAYLSISAKISSLNSNTQIYCGTQHSASLVPVQENDVIDNRIIWTNTTHGILGLLGPNYETYIAFKLNKENGSCYGWIKIIFSEGKLQIDKYAYNKTANEPILAGKLLSY